MVENINEGLSSAVDLNEWMNDWISPLLNLLTPQIFNKPISLLEIFMKHLKWLPKECSQNSNYLTWI